MVLMSPPLYNGMTLVHFHDRGTSQVKNDRLKSSANGEDRTCEESLINLPSMPSGPGPLQEDNLLMASWTSAELTCQNVKELSQGWEFIVGSGWKSYDCTCGVWEKCKLNALEITAGSLTVSLLIVLLLVVLLDLPSKDFFFFPKLFRITEVIWQAISVVTGLSIPCLGGTRVS